MTINFHSEPDHCERLMIPVAEFSYAAYTVHINQGFRCVSPGLPTPTRPNKPLRHGWIREISNWLSRACNPPTTVQ
jgi:hypothetical protein